MRQIKRMMLTTGIAFLLGACNEKKTEEISIYDETQYEKVTPSGREKGYELYVFKSDTARKMMKYYWDNDSVQALSYLYHNKLDGNMTSYFEDGTLSFTGTYKQGEKDGIFTLYNVNGKISLIERYKMGAKTGVWEYYDTTGKLIRKENMK